MRWKPALAVSILTSVTMVSPLASAQRATTDRHVYVRVTGANDAPAKGLTAGDFVVREDDIAREIVRVSPAPPPSHIALLADDSGDLQPMLVDVRSSLLSFVVSMTALPSPPMMSLTTLAERPTTLVDFTTADLAIERGIQKIFPRSGSGTYFLEGIVEACQALRKAGAERPAIVAFVIETSPAFSNVMHTRVADVLKDTRASLWVVELQQSKSPSTSLDARERARVIGDVTTWSGGAGIRTISRQGLTKAFADLSSGILSRYDVTYGRPASLVPPSRLVVETRDRKLRVTAPRWTGP
jgi:hypothetical protein